MRLLLLTAIVATAMTGVARADIDETVTGTISTGSDVAGLFGGGSLVGQTFSLRITGNLPDQSVVNGPGYSYGTASGAADPLTNALTINGITYTPNSYFTGTELYNNIYFGSAFNEYYEYSEALPPYNYIELVAYNFGTNIALASGPPDPVTYLNAVLAGTSPQAYITAYDGTTNQVDVFYINLDTISTSTVPEPSSILLLFTILPALALVARKRIVSRH